MGRIGFDNDKYLSLQSEQITKRINEFGGKLYLEFGGKLFDDYHAARVLPGFQPDSKLRMLLKMRDQAEIIISINTSDIEKNKVRGDLGITYDQDVIRLINAFRSVGLYVGSVVLTKYNEHPLARAFQKKIEALGIKVYRHRTIPGYPSDVNYIVREDGFGRNDYIETQRKLVIVTGPGPGSGKMATCLSQLFHDNKKGIKSGYAKFETFPIWNLPLKHPINIAYEAATADLNDLNMIDPFHLEAYGETTVNYNRDIEIFPVLEAMFKKILGYCPYKSPTDMGVNMAGYCIVDDEVVRAASKEEIVRRYYSISCNYRIGNAEIESVSKAELLMKQANVTPEDRAVVRAALERSENTGGLPAAAISFDDGRIVTGKTSSLLGACAAMILNALKTLAGIDKDIDLISPQIIEPIQKLKIENFKNNNPRLHVDEILIALSICAVTSPIAKRALDCLGGLAGCEAHSSVILSEVDDRTLRKLGINLTCEPQFKSKEYKNGTSDDSN